MADGATNLKLRAAGTAPLLKWPGGKRKLLPHILDVVPDEFGTYYEPFVGGAAVFFALRPKKARLSDQNEDLINCYRQVRDNVDLVISALRNFKNSAKEYYLVRDSKPTDAIERAARLVYLMRLSFNGIYRVNNEGDFNVPYGYNKGFHTVDVEATRAASVALQGIDLTSADFEDAVADAKAGDLVYFDPPYTVAHGRNGFIKYNQKIFKWEDQVRLAKLANALAEKGCHVVVSNAAHAAITELYLSFDQQKVHRASTIAASGEHRRIIEESVFWR